MRTPHQEPDEEAPKCQFEKFHRFISSKFLKFLRAALSGAPTLLHLKISF